MNVFCVLIFDGNNRLCEFVLDQKKQQQLL